MSGQSAPVEAVERFREHLRSLVGVAPVTVGLAVSGGPDSLALLLLARAALSGKVRAATVDHGLRPESAQEAEYVAAICARLGVPHAILRPSTRITGNVQSAARQARYALLEDWRRGQGLDWVATAHHADDQAETLMMRLNRGSGVAGLSGVRAVNRHVIRPLLGWRRSDLDAVVAAVGLDPVADPSNSDEHYDRVRLRRQLRETEWIDPAALARSAAALAEAEASLDWAAQGLWMERAVRTGTGIRIDTAGVPAELRRRLVRRALAELGDGATPRGEALGRLIAQLEAGRIATLAGVKAQGGRLWEFAPAPLRRT
ncbi:MAG TPA: tRNA lysidine(34) synthetase TilS [Allosphingosinicella sp.]|nr:tRNA lysidine(34) synthetase TilS [Allosphingosinicella sp.]